MYRNYTVCVHVRNLHPGSNLHPGANKFAPPRKQEQITRVQILKTTFTWPKINPGCKFATRVCAHERGFSYSMVVRVYVAIMHGCQRVHYRTYTRTHHAITDLYHYNQPTLPWYRDKWRLTLATLFKMVYSRTLKTQHQD